MDHWQDNNIASFQEMGESTGRLQATEIGQDGREKSDEQDWVAYGRSKQFTVMWIRSR